MAIRRIATDLETLRKVSRPIEIFDEDLHALLQDLHDTAGSLNKGNIFAAGLAAIQVGISKRVVLIRRQGKYVEMINPVVTFQSEAKDIAEEGCFSVKSPEGLDYWGKDVKRSKRIRIEYQDRDGNKIAKEVKGFEARAILHEIDHLEGILYTDRARELECE